MQSNSIRAVLFDFGGVITNSPFEAFHRFERQRGLPVGFLQEINRTDPDHNAWARFERGELSAARFDEAFASESRAAGHEVRGLEVVALFSPEHGLDGTEPVIGVAFDGTGFGTAVDGSTQIWGGEILVADYRGFDRVGHLLPLPLPGGDGAVRNPCRIAVAYLTAVGGVDLDGGIPAVAACDPVEFGVVTRQVERGFGSVPTTSMGRLFDAVASLLGVRHRGQLRARRNAKLVEHMR